MRSEILPTDLAVGQNFLYVPPFEPVQTLRRCPALERPPRPFDLAMTDDL